MPLPNIIRDKHLRIVFAIAVVSYPVMAFIVLAKFLPWSDSIVLHFDPYRGIDLVGNRIDLIGAIVAGWILLAMNFLLADFIYRRERFFSYVLSFANAIIGLLLIAAFAIVYSVN